MLARLLVAVSGPLLLDRLCRLRLLLERQGLLKVMLLEVWARRLGLEGLELLPLRPLAHKLKLPRQEVFSVLLLPHQLLEHQQERLASLKRRLLDKNPLLLRPGVTFFCL
jgi:hypothetical protein